MQRKGINYDVGTFPVAGQSSREHFDPPIVQREIEIIKRDLGCTAIRISGQDIQRLTFAAECALQQDLEVWFSPAWNNATQPETLAYFTACAKAAEALRQQSPQIVFVAGCELTFFMQGLVSGPTVFDRMQTFAKPWRLIKSTVLKGSFNTGLNAFLLQATSVIREHFHGLLTYASGPWEQVDWSLFDIVSVDHYRDAANTSTYCETVRAYKQYGKPVVVTEFGCCTYRGADDKGSFGWAIVDRTTTPRRLNGTYVRDETVQATYLAEVLDLLALEVVDGAFVFTFVSPSYPHCDDPQYDLDVASYSVVKSYANRMGTVYPDLPWDPKAAFYTLAAYNRTH